MLELVPQVMMDANIVALYKNKGDRKDCSNYCSISPAQCCVKTFCSGCVKKDSCSCRSGLPIVIVGILSIEVNCRHSVVIRHLQEMYIWQERPLSSPLVISSWPLTLRPEVLDKTGCQPILLSIISALLEDMKGVNVRVVSWRQHIFESFLPSCLSMLLDHLKVEL